jgi:Fic family protein
MPTNDLSSLARIIQSAGPAGMSPDGMEQSLPELSRSTINRRLTQLVREGAIEPVGAGRARRYVTRSPFTKADIDAYFAQDWQQRAVATFDAALLNAEPGLPADKALRMRQIQALANPLDRRFLTQFLVHFSWGSAVLEGSTYSALDTQSLLDYGQRNASKPTEDAVLILNHKRAIEHLWAHPALTVENVCAAHALLTDDHAITEVADSDHFLPVHQRGKPREYEEVNLAASAYIPPFKPGTGFVAQAFEKIVRTACDMPPFQAALYLMTRIPYLQAFANGNKRTARLAANYPLVSAGLLPLSFADVDKAEYIRAMAALYELRSTQWMELLFVESYCRSVVRGSDMPIRLRGAGFDVASVAKALANFVHTGHVPEDERARAFIQARAV